MNDAPSPSSSGAAAARIHHDAPTSNPNLDLPPDTQPTAAELTERRKKNRQLFNRKRGDLLDDLLRNLDILIYAELSTIYYLDCSFLRFLFRAFVQFVFLTLKQSAPASGQQIGNRPVIAPLVTSNVICFLFHALQSPPSAGEATRGYLHGGLAMDFIGQKGPTSKFHLLILDLLILALQLTHMCAGMARKRARDVANVSTPPAVGGNPAPVSSAPPAGVQQDIEAEERGVHRADVEMQTLNPSGSAAAIEPSVSNASASEPLLATTAPRSDAHIFDAFNSGQIVLADLELWKCVKEQWRMVKEMRANSEAASYESQTRMLRREIAGSLLRMRVGTEAMRQGL